MRRNIWVHLYFSPNALSTYLSASEPFTSTHGFCACMYWLPNLEMLRMFRIPSRNLKAIHFFLNKKLRTLGPSWSHWYSGFFLKPGSVYTDTGLLELEVQSIGIGKFADTKKISLLLEVQKKMRVLLELAKKMRVLPWQLSNTAIYWMKSLCCRGVP